MGVLISIDDIRARKSGCPNCPKCGSRRTEEHGTGPGEYNWFLCRECGWNWPTEQQRKIDEARAKK